MVCAHGYAIVACCNFERENLIAMCKVCAHTPQTTYTTDLVYTNTRRIYALIEDAISTAIVQSSHVLVQVS